ncbi:MAG: 3-dehydroquinate dehydratase [Alphaproteobacteria bacterium MarineAlpha6_Bin1]|nr:MAG: 3-dehydroquinate dehydratase [Alphaproteobacteria bacterium MarineAlpha6_Bin1]
MKKIIIINGPNLNLLGNRETAIYGKLTLAEIEQLSKNKANELNLDLNFYQSNSESEIIDLIHKTQTDFDGLIINPAAFTHTSIALLDALKAISKPKIEIHLSNIYNREDYRKNSITSAGIDGMICGFGSLSYILAIEALNSLLVN